MATEIIRRGRNYTIERDPAWEQGRHRLTATLHDQWFRDEADQWQAVDESIVNSDVSGFSHMAKEMAHAIHAKVDGTRRWYPRRNVTTEYVEFGRPQYWTGSAWANIPLNTPTRTGNLLLWDQTNFSISARIDWHCVKLEIILKNAAAARRVRWPVSLTGLTWNNWELVSGTTTVGAVHKPKGYYLANPAEPDRHTSVPVAVSYGSGYVEFTADLTGAVYPVTIDPTFTSQPDATTGLDNYITINSDHYNAGLDTNMPVGGWDASQPIRGLLQFDTSSLPTDAMITTATLSLYCESEADTTDRDVGVHRGLVVWYEGNEVWAIPDPVTDASVWAHRNFNGDVNWTGGAGGVAGTEWTTAATHTETITGVASFDWDVKADAIVWANLSVANNGWWLINPAEMTANSRKRFTTSDGATAANRPKLVIEYVTVVVGSTCWGHLTGVLETNKETFVDNWDGTGAVTGANDAERLELEAGEYMISGIVNTGVAHIQLLQNNYDESGDDVTMEYRHGATEANCLAAAWNAYAAPFESLGYVQIRMTSTL